MTKKPTKRGRACVFALQQGDTPTYGEFKQAVAEGFIDITERGLLAVRDSAVMHATPLPPRAPFIRGNRSGVTSHHNVTVHASLFELTAALGEPHDHGDGEKVTQEWAFENRQGRPVTLYDWKEYGFSPQKRIHWHIGAQGSYGDTQAVRDCVEFKRYLVAMLPKGETPR